MKKMKPFIIVILISLLITGCVSSVVTESELHQIAGRASCDTLGLVYYQGRKKGYDYFRVQWNVGTTRYRLTIPNAVTQEPMPYTSKRDDWVVCGPHSLDSWTPVRSHLGTDVLWMGDSVNLGDSKVLIIPVNE
jgi:hypothetical protein